MPTVPVFSMIAAAWKPVLHWLTTVYATWHANPPELECCVVALAWVDAGDGPVASTASNIEEILTELDGTKVPERSGRALDHETEDAFERLRVAGYL